MPSPFIWYELMTEDTAAAVEFYTAVVGWTAEPWSGSDMAYTIVKAGETGVGGIMTIPPDAKAMGTGPAWMGYVHAPQIDEAAAGIAARGGSVLKEPADIPGVGRFAVVADPHGAAFMLLSPQGADAPPPPAPDTPGLVGWRELMGGNLEEALAFYEGQFGWKRGDAFDMGEVGIYQLFETEGGQGGGMMKRPPTMPQAFWGFYFNVEAIGAATERVKARGGEVVFGPMEVPDGSWIVNCVDPQGAFFALTAPRR